MSVIVNTPTFRNFYQQFQKLIFSKNKISLKQIVLNID